MSHFQFRSPEYVVLRVSYCDWSLYVHQSVHPSVNKYLKILLFWIRQTDFNENSQKLSLGDAFSEYFEDLNSIKTSGGHGKLKKKFKNLFVPNRKGYSFDIWYPSTKILQIMALVWK